MNEEDQRRFTPEELAVFEEARRQGMRDEMARIEEIMAMAKVHPHCRNAALYLATETDWSAEWCTALLRRNIRRYGQHVAYL